MLNPWMRYFYILTLSLVVNVAVANQAPLIPSPPQIAASSYIMMDAESGAVIVEHNAHEALPPASLTKMMTAYVLDYEIAKGNVGLNDQVPVSVNAWQTGGSKMFVREGTTVRLEELLRGIIIQSGNDASVAVAEYLAGSEDAFASIMSQHAARLGMKNSRFMNATGLPHPEHYSSAYDLALLAKAIISQFPEQYAIYSEKYYTYNKIRQPNRNLLLWRDKSVDGLKTGHTKEAGYCLVASAVRNSMRLITVVMGTRSEEARARETLKLLNYGFRYYETHKLYQAGQRLLDTQVWTGVQDHVSLGLVDPIILTIPRGQKNALEASVDVEQVIRAPFHAGDAFGELKITLNDTLLASQPVVALTAVEEAGFFKRIWHEIILFFKGLFA
jgi:serine-type D-Ala-D-Ala carboxypeptidase (penicillin-binding protein 5/6)